MKKYKNDILLIAAILVCAILVFVGITIFQKNGATAKIELNGEVVKQFSLNEDQTFTVDSGEGSYNTVQVKNGKVSVIDASCPDKLCVNQGEVSSAGQNIICLPNKMIVTVNGEKEENAPDVIVQ